MAFKKPKLMMDFKILDFDYSPIHTGKNLSINEALKSINEIVKDKFGFKIKLSNDRKK